MGDIATVLGIGITAIVLLFIAYQFDRKHIVMKILTAFFSIFLLLLVAKATIDGGSNCEIVLNKTTEIYVYGDNFTGYHWDYEYILNPNPNVDDGIFLFHRNITNTYAEFCADNNFITENSFYNLILWFFRISLIYVFVYCFYLAGEAFKRYKYGK